MLKEDETTSLQGLVTDATETDGGIGQIQGCVVVVPCYNEEQRLAPECFLDFVRATDDVRILFVDDGSTDGTGTLLAELARRSNGRISVLEMDSNRGKGLAVQAGLRHAISLGVELVGYLDADLAAPLSEFYRLVRVQQETEADAVLGSRVALAGCDIQRSLVRHWLGRVYATAASFAIQLQVHDTQCGAKVFRSTSALSAALEDPFRTSWAFDVELLARLHMADPRVRYIEVPLRRWTDIRGSKLRFPDMLRAGGDLIPLIAMRHRSHP